ncbi:MAG: erythromycin esterase [Thermomicrobiales bacterium]|nr:erythromycin esterase [Thermomicrobiales bacterium]
MGMSPDRQKDVARSLRRQVVPLARVEVGQGFADLQPLKALVGDARIVALGEATHGTREFFQCKHRLFEFLVVELGFTTFAIEAAWAESLAINEYVLHGRGDPATALAGMYFWTCNTEEVLALIGWMRRYNADPAHETKVTFAGIDAQFTPVAVAAVLRYLAQVDPAYAAEVGPHLDPLREVYLDYGTLPAATVADLSGTGTGVAARLQEEERRYVARSSADACRLACRHARVLCQADEQRRTGDDNKTRYTLRDRAMAESVGWLLETGGPRSKVVVWAHNGHVARDPAGLFDGTVETMGMCLARVYDPQLVVVGFAFGEGAFQAMVEESPGASVLREVAVGPAPEGSLDAMLARLELPAFVVDLRRLDEDAAAWFREPRITREIGALYEGEEAMRQTIVPAARYDALVFVAQTTRARSTVAEVRRRLRPTPVAEPGPGDE